MYLGKIVEIGDRADIYERPQHPYTRALLSAIPDVDDARPGGADPADRRRADAARTRPRAAGSAPAAGRRRTVCATEEPALVTRDGGRAGSPPATSPSTGPTQRSATSGRDEVSPVSLSPVEGVARAEIEPAADPVQAGREGVVGRSPGQLAWARLRRDRTALVSGTRAAALRRCSRWPRR